MTDLESMEECPACEGMTCKFTGMEELQYVEPGTKPEYGAYPCTAGDFKRFECLECGEAWFQGNDSRLYRSQGIFEGDDREDEK